MPTDPWIGVLIEGRYRILDRVARGGMATVYRAHDERLDRPTAVKIMHPHLAEDPQFLERFRREARAAARLDHPGIVAVFDQGIFNDAPYLVMEYVDGPNLRTVLNERGAPPVGTALSLIEQILAALGEAHRNGFVHRDVKPENVLVGPTGRIKVADFGLARAVTEVTAASTGTVLGTVAYLSPELVAEGVADARSDVYALGVMAYELLTGEQPFTGSVPIQVAFQHVNSTIPAPSKRAPWLPASVDEVLGTLTARDREKRPADADAALALVSPLRKELEPEVLEAGPVFIPAGAGTHPSDTEQNDDERASQPSGDPNGTHVLPALNADGTEHTRAIPNLDATMTGAVSLTSGPLGAPSGPEIALLDEAHQTTEKVTRSRRPRKRLIWAIVAVVVVLIGGTVAALFLVGPFARVQLPDLRSQAPAQAQSSIEKLGLPRPKLAERFHDTVPQGKVIGTDPPGGSRVSKDQKVVVLVSKGIEHHTVPDLSGKTQGDAVAALTAAGFGEKPTIAEDFSLEVPKGQVISIDAEAGASLPHNQKFTISISQGPRPVAIPDVADRQRKDAEAALAALNLTTTVTEEFSDSVAAGRVIRQDPKAAANSFEGQTVTLVVSKGPELVAIPNVTGMKTSQAQQALANAGFTNVSVSRFAGGIFDTVRSSDPAAGSSVARDAAITITVV